MKMGITKEITLNVYEISDLKRFLAEKDEDDCDQHYLENLVTSITPAIKKVVEAFTENPADKCSKVFVYGTLKVGGYFAMKFNESRKKVKQGTVKAELWGDKNFRSYPMMQHGEGVVHGELHEYDGDINSLIDDMDHIEGYRWHDPENSLFKRELITVTLDDGSEEQAWAYFFNGFPSGEKPKSVVHHVQGVWHLEYAEANV